MLVPAVSFQPFSSAFARVASVKSMVEEPPPYMLVRWVTVSSEPLRSALVRSASLKTIECLP